VVDTRLFPKARSQPSAYFSVEPTRTIVIRNTSQNGNRCW
jgi:hypothetical protein